MATWLTRAQTGASAGAALGALFGGVGAMPGAVLGGVGYALIGAVSDWEDAQTLAKLNANVAHGPVTETVVPASK